LARFGLLAELPQTDWGKPRGGRIGVKMEEPIAKCLIMCTSPVDEVLHVVSQLELYRMGLQVRLPAQIGLVVFAHIVVN
jgi:hypothetical protein